MAAIVAQIAVVDVYGRAHAFTGEKNPKWCGHILGDGYAVVGNVLAGEQVVKAMAKAFEDSASEPLAERLVRAVEAGYGARRVVFLETDRRAASDFPQFPRRRAEDLAR